MVLSVTVAYVYYETEGPWAMISLWALDPAPVMPPTLLLSMAPLLLLGCSDHLQSLQDYGEIPKNSFSLTPFISLTAS